VISISDLSPALARHILDRMGSTGQPPERGALVVNVATQPLLDVLRDEYLRPMAKSGQNSTFKLVQAPFGGGKTQFLHCLRELAWSEGFLTALVGLSPKECPFDRPVAIYQEVARRIELPVNDIEERPQQGLPQVLRQLAQSRAKESGKDAVLAWLREEFARQPAESAALQRAMRLYIEAVLADDFDTSETLADYLRGESLEAGELSTFKLRERLADDNAFRWLRSLAQCLHILGLPGVVLMFDEMDRNMSLSVRRRRDIGDNLRQMIDLCGQSLLPGVVWCYAVPPEFMDTVVPEYPALAQRLKGAARFSIKSPLQPVIDLDHLPLPPNELMTAIGMRLLELAARAHDHAFDMDLQRANVRLVAKERAERQLESGSRREFVKAIVAMLEDQRRGGERPVKPGEWSQPAQAAPAGALADESEF
jgi:P-loop Domain of unknown function (DUF2791)